MRKGIKFETVFTKQL